MTVQTTTLRADYTGNGSTTAFTVPFYFLDNSHVQIIRTQISTGTPTVLALTTDYTLTGAGVGTGGTATMVVAPTSDQKISILRNIPLTQLTHYVENDPFPAASHEKALDQLTMEVQQLQEAINRSLKISSNNTISSPEFNVSATARANKILSFDANGDLSVTQELGTYKGSWAGSTAYAVRDIVKDGSNSNIYICLTAHTSSGSTPISTNTDASKWALLVDAATATTAASNAASSASAASSSASSASSSASAASTSASTASTAATNASTSATNAASSASSASSSATAASGSATSASNSAALAAASAAAGLYSKVIDKSSNYSVLLADAGTLFRVNTGSGAVTITLPTISTVVDGFKISVVKWSGDSNAVTVSRSGSDTINGATSASISSQYTQTTFVADFETNQWFASTSGLGSTNVVSDVFSGNGSTTAFTLSGDPGAKNNTYVFVGGVYQQKSTYSQSGTTITFSVAPPSGSSNVEIVWTQPLAIGVPGDGTVTPAKLDRSYAALAAANSFTAAQRGAVSALTDGATITPDFAVANNFSVTLGGNRTLANPSNQTAGQAGIIVITQDGTGSRTLAFGSNWKFPTGTAPTLTTTASAVDVLAYYVESASRITARLIGDVK